MTEQADNNEQLDFQTLTGKRLGPYCSFNPVSRVQIWQWCSAMGERNPLYLDDNYRSTTEFAGVRAVAPPAMMQMWTMRDVTMKYAPGSTDETPYQVFDTLAENGFPCNVAVSYDITFHRYLREGDQAHHYTTVTDISALKNTSLGEGYFVTERVEYLDDEASLFAEALITYFQYRSTSSSLKAAPKASPVAASGNSGDRGQHTDAPSDPLTVGHVLPELRIPITHKLIVSGAAASQDYIDGHHNAQAARAAGMPDIFMNILTTCGLSARYITDWAGPESRLQKIAFRLMTPNTPGDTMVMTGKVTGVETSLDANEVTLEFSGSNSLGVHVSGSATLANAWPVTATEEY
jgi:hypothetical protein